MPIGVCFHCGKMFEGSAEDTSGPLGTVFCAPCYALGRLEGTVAPPAHCEHDWHHYGHTLHEDGTLTETWGCQSCGETWKGEGRP